MCAGVQGMEAVHGRVYHNAMMMCILYSVLSSNSDIAECAVAIAAKQYLATAAVVHSQFLAELPCKYR